ncbi:hypothetical protein PAMA_013228 [Pampus argenteus]
MGVKEEEMEKEEKMIIKWKRAILATGIQMTLEVVESKFWAITAQCSSVDGICPLRCDSIAGRFFGEIDGSVMATLIRMGMFKRFLLEFNICGFWHTEHFADASAHKKKDILQPCDTEYPSFVYEPSVKETNSIIKCGRCQKMFVVQQIPESNLLMLVVQADCDCSRQYPPITMEPKEVKYILYIEYAGLTRENV